MQIPGQVLMIETQTKRKRKRKSLRITNKETMNTKHKIRMKTQKIAESVSPKLKTLGTKPRIMIEEA